MSGATFIKSNSNFRNNYSWNSCELILIDHHMIQYSQDKLVCHDSEDLCLLLMRG